ncbi:hypothetical protein GLYMA_06G099600v4 [Glycine max]|nr:hypothetical protein GLYMA_06G099600v4 [Glycine max]KAH1125092.1 hypothetical protein GYH30_014622 [Glycine max]
MPHPRPLHLHPPRRVLHHRRHPLLRRPPPSPAPSSSPSPSVSWNWVWLVRLRHYAARPTAQDITACWAFTCNARGLFLSSILMLPVFIFVTPVLKLIGKPIAVAEQAGLVALWLIRFT